MGLPEPKITHAVAVEHPHPNCDFCPHPAEYDFKTKMGPWANGCAGHWKKYRATQALGIGKGQRLLRAK